MSGVRISPETPYTLQTVDIANGMKLEEVISDLNRDIYSQEQQIKFLLARKEKFEKIKERYPDAHFEAGCICLPDIWDKITCMRIEKKRKYYSAYKINVRFTLNKKNAMSFENLKIHAHPYTNTIAEVSYGRLSNKEIRILDYKSIIPEACPKRKAFIKRIKLSLLESITRHKLSISQNSFEKEEIEKLLLLK